MINLNGREEVVWNCYLLKSCFNSEFSDKDIELIFVWVFFYLFYIGKLLEEFFFRCEFGVNVVGIVRGEWRIYIL